MRNKKSVAGTKTKQFCKIIAFEVCCKKCKIHFMQKDFRDFQNKSLCNKYFQCQMKAEAEMKQKVGCQKEYLFSSTIRATCYKTTPLKILIT